MESIWVCRVILAILALVVIGGFIYGWWCLGAIMNLATRPLKRP
jgi:hypothetical protein